MHAWWDAWVGIVIAASLALNLFLMWLLLRVGRTAKYYKDTVDEAMTSMRDFEKTIKETTDGRAAGTASEHRTAD